MNDRTADPSLRTDAPAAPTQTPPLTSTPAPTTAAGTASAVPGSAAPAVPGASPAAPMPQDPRRAGARRLMVGGVLLLVLAASGGWWFYRQMTHVFVNDARVAANMVAVSSRVPGWVTAIEVVEGDAVKAGKVLVAIDTRESRLLVDELDARLAGIGARREELRARLQMTTQQTASRVDAQEAAIRSAQAAQAAAAAQRDFARIENEQAEKLAPSGMIPRVRLEQTRAAYEAARQQALRAQAELENAQAGLAQAKAARGDLAVLERQLAALGPGEQQLRSRQARAVNDLRDRAIAMPFDGVVDRVFVDVGEYVTPGQRLLMVHDPAQVRIEANVKETDIRHFRPGKTVTVSVDALQGRVFEGTVSSVSHAATSEFALLPNPNPSGNFTKITQRLPVRVTVRQQDGLLKPGMMVELEARVGD